MDDKELVAFSNMTNTSGLMFARRRRILNEARIMIGESGLESFSIRELSRRAGVSSRTLYNAFESKEGIISLAIKAYFEAFGRAVTYTQDHASFGGALERLVTSTVRNREIPHYLSAVSSIYFSKSLHPRIRQVMLDIGTASWRPWIEDIALRRQLKKGVSDQALLLDLSNLVFATIHDWSLGALDGDQFFDRTMDGVLVMLMGATRGAAHRDAAETFRSLKASPLLKQQLLSEAGLRVAGIPAEA